MPTATATFTWTPATGATSQTIRWAASPYTTWSSIVTLSGTASSYIATGVAYGTSYEFQVTSICPAGAPTTLSYFSTSPCSGITTAKYSASLSNAVPLTSLSCCAVNDVTWGVNNGILFPSTGVSLTAGLAGAFNVDGTVMTGFSTTALTSSPLWKNSPATTTNGRMNNQAVSGGSMTPSVVSGFIGFAYTYYAEVAKLIYVGLGTNAYGIINLNGCEILRQTSASQDISAPWKIYPIWVNPGPNFFKFGAIIPTSGVSIGPGKGVSFGIEVYENTAASIIAATVSTSLNIVFSTAAKAGSVITVGDTYGYTCSSGDYYLDTNIPSIGIYPQCVKKM